ncbi:MAG: thioredoxin [Acutalibacteraceae bacterium]|nr:thioredoxin [Clostridia bacterium]MEE3404342.1 thioredoxin [Acutalibacteraceae bacterium]HCA55903.1 thioredoxin [Oscillospiraceae bacterium]
MSVIEITAANFEQEVLKSEQPVMLDFWAVWCGPCRMLSPVIEEIAAENPDIKVGKVNVDNEMSLAERYSIMSIPTVMVFKNGKLVDTSVGVRPKRELLAMIEE